MVGDCGSDGGHDVVDAQREAATARQRRREMTRAGKGRRRQRRYDGDGSGYVASDGDSAGERG